MKNLNLFLLAVVTSLMAAFASTQASAVGTPIDVTAVVADITAQLVPIGLIGAAVLGIIFAIKAFHWVRRAG